MVPAEKSYDEGYARCQAQRSWFRKQVRRLYLAHTLRSIKGRAIDFGCGAGALLSRLPAGSIGLDVNRSAVEHCIRIGLKAQVYEPERDQYQLSICEPGRYATLILSHVLEHLDSPGDILRTLAESCRRIQVERIIVIIPGRKGFHGDATHRTFIDRGYLLDHGLDGISGFHIAHMCYFPGNLSWLGAILRHHELMVIYDRTELTLSS